MYSRVICKLVLNDILMSFFYIVKRLEQNSDVKALYKFHYHYYYYYHSPPVFSFLLSLTERLLIAWLRINKNSWYTKTVSFREEYERSKMITSGKIEHSAKCCFSILLKPFQRVKHLNSSIFWKTVLGEAFLSCIRLVNSWRNLWK